MVERANKALHRTLVNVANFRDYNRLFRVVAGVLSLLSAGEFGRSAAITAYCTYNLLTYPKATRGTCHAVLASVQYDTNFDVLPSSAH
jgi:hypothetical protein